MTPKKQVHIEVERFGNRSGKANGRAHVSFVVCTRLVRRPIVCGMLFCSVGSFVVVYVSDRWEDFLLFDFLVLAPLHFPIL